MRRAGIAALTLTILAVVLFLAADAQPDKLPGPQRHWVKIVFGIDGKDATWDGQLAVSGGKLHDLAEWGFEERDSIDPASFSWKITTGIPAQGRATQAEPVRGVLAEVEGGAAAALSVETKQGNFRCKLSELKAGRPVPFLGGRATVEPLGSGAVAAATETDDDFASIAVDARGHRHVLWIAYDHKEKCNHLLCRDVDDRDSKPEQVALGKEFATAHLFAIPKGGLRAVWCGPGDDGDWDVWTAVRQERGWRSQRLTTVKGTDFQLAAAQGADGTLWLAWQSFRNGNGDIYARCFRDGRWYGADIPVATHPANEWQPAVSVDAKGQAWIAHDSYLNGNYDVYLTHVACTGDRHEVSTPIAIAQGEDFEAHASVLAEGERVWVAYDAAGPGWGKDFRNGPTEVSGKYGEPLHASRRLELRCVIDGKVHRPKAPLPQQLPPDRIKALVRRPESKPSRFHEFPQLARDGDGRLWLLFRLCRQGYCPHPPRGLDWNIYATTYTDRGWLEPIQLPRSQGRQDQRVAFAAGSDGRLHCAWADGNRFASVNRKYVVHFGSLPPLAERAAPLPLEPAAVPPPGTPEPAPKIPWSIARGGKDHHVYFGDLHRHTNISRCSPTIDGCLTDAHRYALDAVELDFLAITDHTRDVDPFSWWRTQQAADLFHVPGRYVPIYGYERSNLAPGGGHRNVFLLKRGHDVNVSDHWYIGRNLPRPDRRPDTTLYPWLREQGGALTAAHTPEYDRGAMRGTWTYNDPQVEPVAEIYQSFRRSYERPDERLREEVSLWHALTRGRKLGFIASSDHLATHTSYACIWATERTREALFEGLQARRTYAATDRIGLEMRIGDALMGEQVKLAGEKVTVSIRALGTQDIDEIQVVRSGKVIAALRPGTREVQTSHVDAEPLRGESWYYVRLTQRDGALAWGSPIWVIRE
jgi:hypothetical protein